MNDALALAHAAQDLLGTPFRLRGRDARTGVDCIGLVSVALARTGRHPPRLPDYAMRNLDLARFARLLPEAGFVHCESALSAGDLLLLRPSAAQFHLAIVGPSGLLVHAHAGLGRVVSSHPASLPWPIEARWHLIES
jgi:cell wall-associated NlpC family hydrolase